MRTHFIFYIISGLLTACTLNSGSNQTNINSEQKIRKQVIEIAGNYAKNKLKNAEKTVTDNGSIIFSAGDTKCLIDPSFIIVGKIDEDSIKDAIVTILTFQGQRLPIKEHLILINKNGKLSIDKELSGEMKFLSISNRIIYIETSRVSPDSPYANCQICKEIKKYKFIAGDTVRIK
jgi:archaellum component FlaF (FlaF/FlaG flagellin family)